MASVTARQVAFAIIEETTEELVIDPLLEAFVTNVAAEAGVDPYWQIVLASLAESGRESVGPIGRQVAEHHQYKQFEASYRSSEEAKGRTVSKAEIRRKFEQLKLLEAMAEQQLAEKKGNTWKKVALTAILVFAGLTFGVGSANLLGPTLSLGLSTYGVFSASQNMVPIKFAFGSIKKSNVKKQLGETISDEEISSLSEVFAYPEFADTEFGNPVEGLFSASEEQKPIATTAMWRRTASFLERKYVNLGDPLLAAKLFLADRGYDVMTELGFYGGQNPNSLNNKIYANALEEYVSTIGLLNAFENELASDNLIEALDFILVKTRASRATLQNILDSQDRVKIEVAKCALRLALHLKKLDALPLDYDSKIITGSVKIWQIESFLEKLRKGSWGGAVYEVTMIIPGTKYDYRNFKNYVGDTYWGATVKNPKDRFIDEVIDALRHYRPDLLQTTFDEEGNLQAVSPYTSCTKYEEALIVAMLKSGIRKSEINDYSNRLSGLHPYDEISLDIGEKVANILLGESKEKDRNYIKTVNLRILELTESLSFTFKREREIVESYCKITGRDFSRDTKEPQILNSILPAGEIPGKTKVLPYYDIAIMISFGHTIPGIARALQRAYPEELGTVNRKTVRQYIARMCGFGSYYEAQKALLKPIIEYMLDCGFSERDVLKAFYTRSRYHSKLSWYRSYIQGKELLDIDYIRSLSDVNKYNFMKDIDSDAINRFITDYYVRHFGFSRKQWIKWAILETPYSDIKAETGLKDENIKTVWLRICEDLFGIEPDNIDARDARNKIRDHFRTLVALDLIMNFRFSNRYIWQRVFGRTDGAKSIASMERFFQTLGSELSVNYPYKSHSGWAEFFELEY